jgi:A/G-specific adenine glycosylase
LGQRLASWYRRTCRDLPWRRTRDPYAIWVSETMLQQTRVETVLPYYERFLRELPDVASLAEAPEERVLALWSGLGYYRRARMLHAAAKKVAGEHAGRMPDDPAALRRLDGVGAYTAGAVASIAFGRRAALVDGNVARVLARLFAVEEDVKSAAGAARVWAIAERLVGAVQEPPGEWNQALMELGATVCVPRAPLCAVCPVAPWCAARSLGIAAELPRVSPK